METNNDSLLNEYLNYYSENHKKIEILYNNINLSVLKTTITLTNVHETVICIFGSISALFNGPRKAWIEIKGFLSSNNILDLLLNYKELTRFSSYNNICQDYNILKTINIRQTSADYDDLIKIYLLIVENLGILIKLKTLKGEN